MDFPHNSGILLQARRRLWTTTTSESQPGFFSKGDNCCDQGRNNVGVPAGVTSTVDFGQGLKRQRFDLCCCGKELISNIQASRSMESPLEGNVDDPLQSIGAGPVRSK